MSNITTNVTLGEDKLHLNNIEKDIVIDINGIVDFSKQPYVNSYLQQGKQQDMVLYGKIMGFADSLFPRKDIIIAILNEVEAYEESFFVDVYFPSNEKVKSRILFFINKCNLNREELTLEELEQNKDYLVSKVAAEFVMLLAAMESSVALITAGKVLFDAGMLKIASGTALLILPGGEVVAVVCVEEVIVGSAQAVAGVAVATAGVGIALSVGRNAGNSAWDDYCKLKQMSNPNPISQLNIDSKQLGKKWGKHKFDYPDMKDFKEYKSAIENVFDSPEKVVYDSFNKEYYYIKGNDLLRVGLDGDFISLYPGANTERVLKAIEAGGTIMGR